jgi:hypothetical protein
MKERPCGIYRTTVAIGEAVPAGALVYFHNHGDPGPGVYLPREWRGNRAVFQERGTTVTDEHYIESLEPLLAEGLYRVIEAFFCCEKKCALFDEDQLVQLGYDGQGSAILFLPELIDGAVALPEHGTRVASWQLQRLRPLKLNVGKGTPALPAHDLN